MDPPTLDYESPEPRPSRWAIVAGGAVVGFILSHVLVGLPAKDGPLLPVLVVFSPPVLIVLLADVPDRLSPAVVTLSGTALFALYALAGCSARRARYLGIALCVH